MAVTQGKAVIPGMPAHWRQRLVLAAGVLLPALALGCQAPLTESRMPESLPPQSPAAVSLGAPAPAPSGGVIRLVSQEAMPDDKKDLYGSGGKEGPAAPKEKITLPLAIQMCITQNFRLRAGADKVRQAEAELVTASLIPNSSVLADYQLIPLQRADIDHQLGPPQADVLLSIPMDWLLFGKRVAQIQAARLGIDVSSADYADLHRQQVGRTVDAFYEVLADAEFFRLAEENVKELEHIEEITQELARNNKAGKVELDRVKLAVLEAVLERHDRELALDIAKARLRPFIGRTATDPDYDVDGTLKVSAMVPPPKLADAVALAEAQRPDLISDQREIDQAEAQVKVERRKAKPQVSLIPGWTYQNQRHINGFPNGSMFDIGVSTTLPLTDRNQGNIRKALAHEEELRHTYLADRADALAEVEAALASYSDAVEHLTLFNSPVTLKAAHELHERMEAALRAGTRQLDAALLAHKAYRDRLTHVVEFQSDYWRNLNRLNMAVGLHDYYANRQDSTQRP
jgi:cobalt-zinc-cadmium efflux system outer membrane protein